MTDSTRPDGYSAAKILTWVLGVIATLATIGIAATVGMLIDTGDRLTAIETTISENRQERQAQIASLERRVDRIEADLDERRNGQRRE